MRNRVQKFVFGAVAATVALQSYIVRELLATLILVAVVFSAFPALVLTLKMLHWVYARTFAGAAAWARSDFNNRPFRRLRSLTAR